MIHPLKTWPEYFEVVGKDKTFEVRKNDRNFQVGDVLWLQEWVPETREYTGRDKKFTVTYLLEGGQFGIEKGYCVMGLAQVNQIRTDYFDSIFKDILAKRPRLKYMSSDEAEEIFK